MLASRRGFLFGVAALAAPALIRTPGLLMPIKALAVPPPTLAFTGFGYATIKVEGEAIAYDADLVLGDGRLREMFEAGVRSYWIRNANAVDR